MEQEESLDVARKLALSWYQKGRDDFFIHGRYSAPDHAILRRSYAEGWADEIMGVAPSEEQVLLTIFGEE